MSRSKIVVVLLILLLIGTGLIASANFIMKQQYPLDRQGKLIEEYNAHLKENGVAGLNNLTYMIHSGLVLSFNRPIQNDGFVRSDENSYFLV